MMIAKAFDTNGGPPIMKGTKHDSGKPQYRLLPLAQLEGVVRVLEYGAKIYGEGNWKHVEDGYNRYIDAAIRHMAKHLDGHLLDDEPDKNGRCSGLLHIDHCIASLIMARHFTLKTPKEVEVE